MLRKLVAAISVLFVLSLAACGNHAGRQVGAACVVDGDCDGGSMCLRGGDYPGGLCSMHCNNTNQCPSIAACIKKDGGVCLVLCQTDHDCPGGWKCKDKDLQGEPGKAGVCLGK